MSTKKPSSTTASSKALPSTPSIPSTPSPMPFHVKGNLRDLLKFKNLVPIRRKRIAAAPASLLDPPYINTLSHQMHPLHQHLTIASITDESPSSKTFRLVPNSALGTTQCAYFRAGQYLSLHVDVNGTLITRPFSIASSPTEALQGFYEITIKHLEGGFLTDFIWTQWQIGQPITASGPLGTFYYEPLRDSSKIIGIAGGSGITPFRSLLKEILAGHIDATLHLIYGCSDDQDIIYYSEFQELAALHPDRFQLTYVLSCDEIHLEGCETGFITADLLQRYSDPTRDSYFLCGPALMYDFVETELQKLGVPRRRIRMEAYGEIRNVGRFSTFPQLLLNSQFQITVWKGSERIEIPAKASETVLIALERAQLAPPSACRSGECQICRSRLLKGELWVSPHSDGRRHADIQFGYFHPCASFPISDLEMELPPKK